MKLLRYGSYGKERPGILDREGNIRDLSHHIYDIVPEVLSPETLTRFASLDL